ncbi:MAG: glycosyltransferase family 2 protein, partial [Henriciella sp.]
MTPAAVTVVIPTYNRPDSLHRAVESLFWQSIRKEGFSVLIADNSADASARMVFDALAVKAPETIRLSYLHVPAPGVANARNAAMDAVNTDLVAFLDDDQSAPIHWLEELLGAYDAYGAAVTFGPIAVDVPDHVKKHRAYFEHFFGREPHHRPGYIDKPYGCGNSLLDTAQIPGGKPWFDTKMN